MMRPKLILLFLLPIYARAGEHHHHLLLHISQALLAAASSADAATSMSPNLVERNPLLASPNGQFAARGAMIKFSILGAAIASQQLLVRRHREVERPAAAANMAAAGVLGVAAWRNARQ